jgi:hypothetical protein
MFGHLVILQLQIPTLQFAVYRGRLDIVKFLVKECGADVHAKNAVSEDFVIYLFIRNRISMSRKRPKTCTVQSNSF